MNLLTRLKVYGMIKSNDFQLFRDPVFKASIPQYNLCNYIIKSCITITSPFTSFSPYALRGRYFYSSIFFNLYNPVSRASFK